MIRVGEQPRAEPGALRRRVDVQRRELAHRLARVAVAARLDGRVAGDPSADLSDPCL